MGYPIDVRYSDCDMQRVVHNSNYLKWSDDIADLWFRDLGADLEGGEWDVMVKSATLTWSAPARVRDRIEIDVAATRFGNTSFDLTFRGTRGDDLLYECTITYVCVRTGTLETVPVPDGFRRAASDASASV